MACICTNPNSNRLTSEILTLDTRRKNSIAFLSHAELSAEENVVKF